MIGVGFFFVGLMFAALLGFPLETRAGREKRAAVALQLQAADIQREAARQISVQAEIARQRGGD